MSTRQKKRKNEERKKEKKKREKKRKKKENPLKKKNQPYPLNRVTKVPFMKRFRRMLEDPTHGHVVRWSQSGDSFIVVDVRCVLHAILLCFSCFPHS